MLDSLNNVGWGIGADKDAGSEPTSQTLESTTPSELHRLSDNIYFSHKVWFDLWIKHAGSSQLLVTVATGADGGTTVIRPKFSSSNQTLLQTTGKICTAGNLGLHSTLYDFCKLS